MALEQGMRHLDLAEMYGTDEEVALALKASNVPRSELFITSKLLKSFSDVDTAGSIQATAQKLIDTLGVGHIDLMLLHAPFLPDGVTIEKAWRAMEGLVDAGLVRSIGVSNFREEDIRHLIPLVRIKPVINQVEFHPYLQQESLCELCRSHGVVMEGYGGLMPLTHKKGGPVDAVLEDIATSRSLTLAQVLHLWALQKGVVVVTTGSQTQRISESLDAAEAAARSDDEEAPVHRLSREDISRIDAAGAQLPYRKYWQKEFGSEQDWKRPSHSLT